MENRERGASSKYKGTLTNKEIIGLDIKNIASDNSVLALWVPSSFLQVGLDTMKAWGFTQKQTWIWVKTKQKPLQQLKKNLRKKYNPNTKFSDIADEIDKFELDESLNFFMGHLFRQTHEICLIGTKGKYSSLIKNKSQRSVNLHSAIKEHSKKPDELQIRLDRMFPSAKNKLEIFARRDYPGWICVGNECPSTKDEDIRNSIERLKLK